MKEAFTEGLEKAAASVLDAIASLLGYRDEPLRGAPSDGSVTLPDDLFAKRDVQTEWWYYTGHCQREDGRRFGFELVFFKRRTDLDRIGVLPMTALANPMYFAHFAISDIDAQTFRYDHIRSFDKPLDTPVAMSETSCDVRLGDWSLREVAGRHILHATLNDGLKFDAILEPTKPVVLNGDEGSGIAKKGNGGSNHFSFTRMSVAGQTNADGKVETFTGSAWMDREFGIWEHGYWDWFSIQFDDATELMIYRFKNQDGSEGESTGTFVDVDGNCSYLTRADFEIETVSTWTSPRNGAVYPASSRVRVQKLDIDINIAPLIADQELDTRGTTMVVYWEGCCDVAGTKAGVSITGRAYVELVGYDRSHENVDLATFLFGAQIEKFKQAIA
ncbi:MAG: lipocalin family protein [Pyrinomonadaceae bacterium]